MEPRFLIAVLPVLLLVPAADGQEPPTHHRLDCEVLIPPVEDGLASVAERTRVARSVGARVQIDVAFKYTNGTTASGWWWDHDRNESPLDRLVERVNAIYRASGIGVEFHRIRNTKGQAPRALRHYDGHENRQNLLNGLRIAYSGQGLATPPESEEAFRRLREADGMDIVIGLYASSPSSLGGGGAAYVWSPGVSAKQMKRYAYGVVGLPKVERTSRITEAQWRGVSWGLAHELGHILGLVHDDGSGSVTRPFATYGRGYVDQQQRWRYGTVMSTVNWFAEGAFRFSANHRADRLEIGHGDARAVLHDARIGSTRHNSSRAATLTIDDVAEFTEHCPARCDPWDPKYDDDGDDEDPDEGEPVDPVGPPTAAAIEINDVEVTLTFRDPNSGQTKNAIDTGYDVGHNARVLYFFSRDNPEALVKVLDGCSHNGHKWIYASVASDLSYRFEAGGYVWQVDGARDPAVRSTNHVRCAR